MEDILGISIIRDPGTQTNFDLLAIHGINGHPYHTWTHPNGAKWLEDYLPEDMPNAGIMTFGYNSQIFTSSKGFVTDFAEQLLQHLMSIRRSTDSTDRPIIFLCHSLGGLVVKKALTLAQEAHDAAAVRKSTILVAFMGTPHRGSQLASYAEIAVTCIKTTGFKANTANIHHLKLDSDALEELGSQFGSLLQMENIKVLTFYELRPIKLAGIAEVIVVPKWSAKLGLGPPLETIIPVDADHRQIAQFTGRSSKQYEVFRSNIVFASSPYAQMTQTNECLSKDRKWKQIILWLGGLRCQPGPALRKECVEGTCKWIYEKQKFQNWRGSKRPAGLWIYGKPGVGKTVLSSYISHLLRSEDGNLVITLYCHLYRSLNEPLYALLRDILLQALQLPYLSTIVKQRLLDLESQISALSDISFDTLLEIVDKMLYSTSKLVLIVDGIDELEQEAANLEYFLHKIHTISQSGGLCKILIVSRNTSTLERLLGSWQMMAISSVDSLHDISIFLHRKLRHMSHLGDRRDVVIERLVDGSKGLFLWADLAVSEIDHLRTWNEVQALLESGNCGLDAIYATVIKQLDTSSKGLCRIRARALPLVSIAYRPLRLEEIQELLAVEVSKGFVEPGNRILGGWSTLSRACGPFLEINGLGTVELIHVSAKEFLMTHQWARSLAQEHLIDGSAEIEMTCLCLTYLSFNDFGRTREDIKLDIDSLNQKYPMLEYASQFWPVHFLRSEKITTLQLVLLDKFLNCQCSAIWATMFYPYFSIRHGETIETTLTIQHSILANLERNLRTCGNDDLGLSNRCIEKCRRLLLDSTRNSLVMEKFHSGPAAKVTLKKSLRFAKCCCALNELEAAKEVASEALKIAEETFGRMQPLTLQLQRMKLYIRTRIQHKSPTLDSYNVIPDFVILVKNHIKVFGVDHSKTLGCQYDLGLVHFIRREFTQARKHLEALYRRKVEALGYTSRVTQSIATNLAACANIQEEYGYAESILYASFPGPLKAAAEQLEIDITSVSPYTLHALSILAAVLGARNEDRRSEILHQRVIDGFMALNGEKSPRLYESAINKGQAMRDQFKYCEARKHYHEWLKISDQNLGPESSQSHEMRKRLIDIDHREKKLDELSQSSKGPEAQELDTWRQLGSIFAATLGILAATFMAWIWVLWTL